MVVRANKKFPELGGHIGTFASAATLYDVGMNHFWRAKNNKFGGDLVYFQGHSAPGIYARAFLEGRISSKQLDGFRQEVNKGGLSSYPHPWLMPNFWQFPTVSMGLGPIMGIYQARFLKYLINRGLVKDEGRKIWVFLGDGEMDEPESLGAIGLAAREKLDNLIFVINCNLQRFIDTYFSQVDGKYFTGDGCRRDKDGYYWITGRVDDVIIVSGHNLGTAEIESAFVAHPKVAEAAVVGFPHSIKGNGLYCYVTLNIDEKESGDLARDLKQWVKKIVGAHCYPDVVQFAPGLPKTRSGKIMRRILRKIAANDPDNLGDTTTLADPSVVESLIQNRQNKG